MTLIGPAQVDFGRGFLNSNRLSSFGDAAFARTLSDGEICWVLTVYIHYPLRWDDPPGGEITDADEEQAILSRLEIALKTKGDYQVTPDAR